VYGLESRELRRLRSLNTPRKIQDYLNSLVQNYEPEGDTCLSPRRVMREKRAHCIEGAMLAALAFRFKDKGRLFSILKAQDTILIMLLLYSSSMDVGVLFQKRITLRCVIVSRFTKRYASSCFLIFMNILTRMVSRRSVATHRPVDLSRFDKRGWMTNEKDNWFVAQHLVEVKHYNLLTRSQIATLRKADAIEIEAGEIVEWKKGKRLT
jgi:hypothetical protein